MADNRFASVPNISIPRSRFKQPFNHSLTFQHGDLVPIDCFDILPGDTYKLDLASLIWMSNPIRPIFGNITAHIDVFFVPMRLVWQYTKEFFGENKTTSGYQAASYKVPSWPLGKNFSAAGTTFSGCPVAGSISHYLGKPIVAANAISSGNQVPVTYLKERAYCEIWNNYYRSQQLQNPVAVAYVGNGLQSTPGALIGSLAGTQIDFATMPFKVNKEFDYFTAATLYPQYGPAVTLPLGSFAPVVTIPTSQLADVDPSVVTYAKKSGQGLKWLISQSSPAFKSAAFQLGIENNNTVANGATSVTTSDVVVPANLAADLSAATAATINQLRYAFAVQKYLERSNFGTRFFEMLQVHYGVTSPDASLQIPQRIGHADFPINISTVLSTAGAADDAQTQLGVPGAASCTASKKYMFTHAFTEPGYLMILLSTTHERSYTQGILREDMKVDRYEIYSPEFANLGDQEIKNCEIYYGNDVYNADVFGYQEHWAEYRYRAHRVSGMLDPVANNGVPSPWILTDHYQQRPSLDGSWLQEDRDWVATCLVSGEDGIDYTGDFFFDYTATREMPLFTIPGLIDHFGSY